MEVSFKKILIAIIITLLLSGCGLIANEVVESDDEGKAPFTHAISSANDPESVAAWLNSNIMYKPDSGNPADEFRAPEVTYQLGFGDCEDMAIIAEYALSRNDYNVSLLAIYTETEGHVVCLITDKDSGRLNYISNNKYIKIAAASTEVIAKDIYPQYTFYQYL